MNKQNMSEHMHQRTGDYIFLQQETSQLWTELVDYGCVRWLPCVCNGRGFFFTLTCAIIVYSLDAANYRKTLEQRWRHSKRSYNTACICDLTCICIYIHMDALCRLLSTCIHQMLLTTGRVSKGQCNLQAGHCNLPRTMQPWSRILQPLQWLEESRRVQQARYVNA